MSCDNNKSVLENSEEITVAKKILSDAGSPHIISELQWMIISDIVNNPTQFDIREISTDLIVLSTLIDTPFVPMEIKKEALDTMTSVDSSISKNFAAPILFYGNPENFKQLSPHMAFRLISQIDWQDFNSELYTYSVQYPNATQLPFSNTNLERILVQRLLNDTSKGYKIPSNVYHFVEYVSNTDSIDCLLKQKLEPSSPLILALLNNPHISLEKKEALFSLNTDISDIKFCPSDKAKELYDSAIYPISHPDDFVYDNKEDFLKFSSDCILNLINNNLLPETCEIDLIKRFVNGELHKSQNFIATLLNTTRNIDVLKEVFNLKNSSLVANVLKNPNTPVVMQKMIVEKYLSDTTNKNLGGTWSDWDYFDDYFLLECCKTPLPEMTYLSLISSMPSSIGMSALHTIALNPNTTENVLNYISKKYIHSFPMQTYCYFNKTIKDKFSLADAQKFLNTIDVIYNRTQRNTDVSYRYNELFFPVSNDLLLQKTIEVLDNAMAENRLTPIENCAKFYKNKIIEKQVEFKAEEIIKTFNVEDANISVLNEAKLKIHDKIFSPYYDAFTQSEMQNTTIDSYLFYKNLMKYVDLYNKINNKIQELTIDDDHTSIKYQEDHII